MKKLVSVMALAMLLVGCATKTDQSTQPADKEATAEQTLGTSEMTQNNLDFTVKDKDGNDVKLSDYKGKKVYLNVWASWCGPCKHEMPELEEVYQAFKDKEDYAFLSVTSPDDKEFANSNPADASKETILATAKKAGVTYPVLFDTKDQAMSALAISAFPTHYFINSDGTVHTTYMGGLTKEGLTQFLEELK